MSRVVAFGEIMGRLSPPGFQRFQQAMPGSMEVTFAGAEASIAASIAFLGGEAAFVTALPQHAIADACIADLRAMGVDTQHIIRADVGRLGLYFYEKGANQRASQVIYDREGSSISILSAEHYDWRTILAGAGWLVVSGITPAISRNAAEVTKVAMSVANSLGVKVACDMNYRSKLWQWEPPLSARELATKTMRELLPMVDMFIGGLEDASEVLGLASAGSDPGTIRMICKGIANAFPRLRYVAMTRRIGSSANRNEFGGMLFDVENQEMVWAPQLDNQPSLYVIDDIVDRLGAGDAFTAGLLYQFTTQNLLVLQRAIDFATAAGCLAHSIEGDYNYVSRSEIEAIAAGDRGGRVSR